MELLGIDMDAVLRRLARPDEDGAPSPSVDFWRRAVDRVGCRLPDGRIEFIRPGALRIADNQLASLAGWDDALLEMELSALREMDYDLSFSASTRTCWGRCWSRSGRTKRWSPPRWSRSVPNRSELMKCEALAKILFGKHVHPSVKTE